MLHFWEHIHTRKRNSSFPVQTSKGKFRQKLWSTWGVGERGKLLHSLPDLPKVITWNLMHCSVIQTQNLCLFTYCGHCSPWVSSVAVRSLYCEVILPDRLIVRLTGELNHSRERVNPEPSDSLDVPTDYLICQTIWRVVLFNGSHLSNFVEGCQWFTMFIFPMYIHYDKVFNFSNGNLNFPGDNVNPFAC